MKRNRVAGSSVQRDHEGKDCGEFPAYMTDSLYLNRDSLLITVRRQHKIYQIYQNYCPQACLHMCKHVLRHMLELEPWSCSCYTYYDTQIVFILYLYFFIFRLSIRWHQASWYSGNSMKSSSGDVGSNNLSVNNGCSDKFLLVLFSPQWVNVWKFCLRGYFYLEI